MNALLTKVLGLLPSDVAKEFTDFLAYRHLMSFEKEVEVIKVQEDAYNSEETRFIHPAFGVISASRITGRCKLNDTDYNVSTYIEVRIKTAKVRRRLSGWWHHEDYSVCTVQLSEVQWASFISSLNTMPVPCTIHSSYGNRLPRIKEELSTEQDLYRKELEKYMSQAKIGLEMAVNIIKDPANKIPKKLVGELVSILTTTHHNTGSNLEFVKKQFDEHIEQKTSHAKTDINQYTYSLLNHLGIKLLKDSDGDLVKALEEKKDL